MIREGIVTFPYRLHGYGDIATQEEAERLSGGIHKTGMVIFVPARNIKQTDIDIHFATKEEVAV